MALRPLNPSCGSWLLSGSGPKPVVCGTLCAVSAALWARAVSMLLLADPPQLPPLLSAPGPWHVPLLSLESALFLHRPVNACFLRSLSAASLGKHFLIGLRSHTGGSTHLCDTYILVCASSSLGLARLPYQTLSSRRGAPAWLHLQMPVSQSRACSLNVCGTTGAGWAVQPAGSPVGSRRRLPLPCPWRARKGRFKWDEREFLGQQGWDIQSSACPRRTDLGLIKAKRVRLGGPDLSQPRHMGHTAPPLPPGPVPGRAGEPSSPGRPSWMQKGLVCCTGTALGRGLPFLPRGFWLPAVPHVCLGLAPLPAPPEAAASPPGQLSRIPPHPPQPRTRFGSSQSLLMPRLTQGPELHGVGTPQTGILSDGKGGWGCV